jgi:hypothetical protein
MLSFLAVIAATASLLQFVTPVATAPVSSVIGSQMQRLVTRENLFPRVKQHTCSQSYQGCSQCVKHNCRFSKTTFKCENPGAGGDFVTTSTGCPQINQLQRVFQAKKGKNGARTIKHGEHTPDVRAKWDTMATHVLHGDGPDSHPTSGRHTSDSFRAANPGLGAPTHVNQETHIMRWGTAENPTKTVWDSAHYSETDIKNMCAVAIALRGQAPRGAFVVQSPHGVPACIETFTAGQGSCYPKGSGNVQHLKLGAPC